MFKKCAWVLGYSVVFAGMLDLPCHKMFHICINPINIVICNIRDKDPNTYGNQMVGVNP